MLILSEFDIQFRLPAPTAIVAVLSVHPSLESRVRAGNKLAVEHFTTSIADAPAFTDGPKVNVSCTDFIDSFGNRCARFFAPKGHLRLSGSSVVETDAKPDPNDVRAEQASVQNLPADVLQFLLPSRYCQVDQFGGIAQDLFGSTAPGWARAVAIRDWVHARVAFNYNAARPTKTSMDVFTERVGVCRDFQHLAITLSRCMNIPARYATGYVGDIRRPFSGPGDFSAWYQVFLGGKWINIDARHNYPRIGRVLMATGRDAADVAITTSFGAAYLAHFYVESNEVDPQGNKVPLPEALEIPQPIPHELKTPTQTNGSEASPTQTQSATL
ncbi:transglutaminase-like domain-containing protein [Granulicella sibirica]|uniref:Transglutaminase-like domain n=1 Tax=Granulicella sibirica TaxID=2479048 RepID=A0A4V1L5K7_9BACT|nr:transglutaminase family protein [Granulicella sibirica]RXH56104.1 Transglutaminase-like domain [Granulicella sibirica]